MRPFSFALVIYHSLPIAGLVQAVSSLLAAARVGQEPHGIAFNITQYTLTSGSRTLRSNWPTPAPPSCRGCRSGR